jgi:hypothetical protein
MANEEEDQSPRGFKVQDRRRFVDDAASTSDATAESAPQAEPSDAARADTRQPSPIGDERAEGHGGEPHAEINFTTFVMGLTTQALMHLGEIADPAHPQPPDLAAAKQMIDLLGILRDKTKGNLDNAEEQLLANMLYDLRMRYVEVSRHR